MSRLILIAALLLGLLFATERLVEHRREAHRRQMATLRLLPVVEGVSTDAIRHLKITFGDTAWTYRFDNAWRYPAYENAYVLGDQIRGFIEGIAASHGTVVATNRRDAARYGIDAPDVLTVTLQDSTGAWTQTILIGHSLPRAAQEAYMAVADNDTLFHVHADPRPILSHLRHPRRAPLIDPKVLPSALPRRAIAHIAFRAPDYPVSGIERVEIKSDDPMHRLQDGPMYEWYATIGQSRRKIDNPATYAYLSFLGRITYADLHAPKADYGFDGRTIALTDDAGATEILDIGGQSPDGHTYVRHHTTGLVMTLAPEKADLLFPSPGILDALPDPSPYLQAEGPNP